MTAATVSTVRCPVCSMLSPCGSERRNRGATGRTPLQSSESESDVASRRSWCCGSAAGVVGTSESESESVSDIKGTASGSSNVMLMRGPRGVSSTSGTSSKWAAGGFGRGGDDGIGDVAGDGKGDVAREGVGDGAAEDVGEAALDEEAEDETAEDEEGEEA
ncbi:hypothetical protein M8J77_005655 [Diaphorina citri]|nr:hypothetical protein M8J77_005655 [Diaphorina citri]